MKTVVPSPETVRCGLRALTLGELDALSMSSGVPFSTLSKIRNGHTPNPGLDTVRKFFHLLPESPATPHTPAAQAAEQGVANA